jgi:hypothetical protein
MSPKYKKQKKGEKLNHMPTNQQETEMRRKMKSYAHKPTNKILHQYISCRAFINT